MPSTFHDLVKKKIKAFRGKYPPIHSAHEGLAIIDEEVGELRKEVHSRKRIDDPFKMLNELVDIAAQAEIMAEDIQHFKPGRNHR